MPFITTRDTSIQSFQYEILHRILPYNEWLNNIKINSEKTCCYCNEIYTITHLLIECKRNKYFWKGWSRWWHSITGFNLREEDYIYEYIYYLGSLERLITPLLQTTVSCMQSNTSI